MQITEFKNWTAKRSALANIDILGSFDFYTSLLSLDALSAKDIHKMHEAFDVASLNELIERGPLTPEQYSLAAKVLPLAAHEYTHFIDATSTLWGFRHLSLMNEAYLSNDKYGASELQFSKAKLFYDHNRRIRLPNYYTVVYPDVSNVRPWQSTISIGYLFSSVGEPTDKPILFSRFSNHQGELLARSPISMISLLEASAMAQELLVQSVLLQLAEPDFRLVENSQLTQRTIDYLYNPAITEYSVCAHIVANQQNCNDALAAFRLCAIIIRAVLNFPEQAVSQLYDKCPVEDLLKTHDGHPFAKAIRNGLYHNDLGVIFYMICIALPESSYVNEKAAIDGVVSAFGSLGLNFTNFCEQSNARAAELCTHILNTTIQPIALLAQAGKNNFQEISASSSLLDFVRLSLPPALLGDSSLSLVFGSAANLLKEFDFEACFNELSAGQSWVERFAEACV